MGSSERVFQHRVLILGLDGLSLSIYRALRGHGYLHPLARLESRGVIGSVPMIPPYTPPMWTSIVSGVNPGKHGIYHFFLTDESGRVIRLHLATDVMHPRLHDIVSYWGGESLVVNLPLSSWPLIPFRGAIISDWVSPREYAKPAWLDEIYKSVLRSVTGEFSKRGNLCSVLAGDMALIETLERASRRGLFEGKAYAFVMLRFIDALIHTYPGEVYNPRDECFKQLLGAFDSLVEEVLVPEFADKGLIIVVSDHGVDKAEYRVSITRILYDHGLIRIRFKAYRDSEGGAKSPLIARIASRLMRSRVAGRIITRIGRRILLHLPRLRSIASQVERPSIDEDNSPVILPREWSMGLYINTRIVSNPGALAEKIVELLKRFEEETGHHFAYSIELGRKLFHGPYTRNAPHIIVSPAKGYSLSSINIYADPIEEVKGRIGDHHPENMHIITLPAGNPVIEEAAREVREPWDYATLALLALNLPLPHDTDSQLCRRAGIDCKHANYNTKYTLARRIAQKHAQLQHEKQ